MSVEYHIQASDLNDSVASLSQSSFLALSHLAVAVTLLPVPAFILPVIEMAGVVQGALGRSGIPVQPNTNDIEIDSIFEHSFSTKAWHPESGVTHQGFQALAFEALNKEVGGRPNR